MLRGLPAGQRLVLLLSAVFTCAAVVLAVAGVHVTRGAARAQAGQRTTQGHTTPGFGDARGTASGVAAERALRALVTVTVRSAAHAQEEPTTVASGVVLDNKVIVTNAHLVSPATDFEVAIHGRPAIAAKLVGTDLETNLAVLTLTGDTSGFAPLKLADSSTAKVGEPVLVAANRPEAGPSVTFGIISAIPERASESYEPFLRTDAGLGEDGAGALVDMNGDVLGIAATAPTDGDRGPAGLGFVIPSDAVRAIVKSLLERGRVEHGFLGVRVQALEPGLASALMVPNSDGVLVAEVQTGSPAERGGIERGDVVLGIDGHSVRSAFEFGSRVAATKPGTKIGFDISRRGLRRSVEATLAAAPEHSTTAASASPLPPLSLGLTLSTLGRAERQRWTVPDSVRSGLVVDEVTPGTPIAKSGLRPGDVLLELDRQPVTTRDQVARQWRESTAAVLVLAWRAGHTLYTAIEPSRR